MRSTTSLIKMTKRRFWYRLGPLGCALLSGVAGLLYQVLWNRQLLLLFGSTSAAAASVVAAFMAGMSIGAWAISHHPVRRDWSPMRLYAVLELGIAVYALAFHPLLTDLQTVYPALWDAALGHPVLLNLMRLGLGFVMLVLPTTAMGATVPLLVEAMHRELRYAAVSVAWIYGINAGGGAAGAALAGFLLLPSLGIEYTLLIGVVFSVTAAVIGVLSARRQYKPLRSTSPGSDRLSNVATVVGRRSSRRVFIALLIGTGFANLGYEVLWTRMLVLVTGSSTYAFSLMLALYVAGLAIGSLWLARKIDKLRVPADVFSHLQIGVGILVVTGLWLFGRFPDWQLGLYQTWGTGFDTALMIDTILAAVIIVPPTILLGASFPIAARILHTGVDRSAGTSITLAALTLGNVAGALAAGTFLVPWLGLEGAVLALVAVTLVCGFLVVFTSFGSKVGRRLTTVVGIAVMVVGIPVVPDWNPLLLTSGVYERAPVYLGLLGNSVALGNLLKTYRLRYFGQGNQAVVSVIQFPTLKKRPHLALSIDGKVDASTGKDMSTQILSAHLGMFLRRNIQDVLVIGLASGVTVGSVEQWPGVRDITVAEISPTVVRSERQFTPYNHQAMQDPRVHLVVDDGRHYLTVTRHRFQLVISEPSNPWLSGPARLFTREFFQQVRDHLAPRGVYVQWLPLYGLSTHLLKAEVRTFLSVFPNVAMLRVSAGDVLLVGAAQPLVPETDKTIPGGVRTDMRRVGYDRWHLFADFLTGGEGLRQWAGKGRINTDNNGLLEFGAPRYLLAQTLQANVDSLESAPWRKSLEQWAHAAPLRIAESYFRSGKFKRAFYLATKTLPGAQKWMLLGNLDAEKGNWVSARLMWTKANTADGWLKLAHLANNDAQPEKGLQLLEKITPQKQNQYYFYTRMLLQWQVGNIAAAVASARHMQLVIPPQHGWQVLASYMKEMLFHKIGTNPGESATKIPGRHAFARSLDSLRRGLERENGEKILDALLHRVRDLPPGLLSAGEYKHLESMIGRRVLTPLSIYNRGVSLFFMGRYGGARLTFGEYMQSLPAHSGATYATVLLNRIHLIKNSSKAMN